ncbi:MAG: hypothetical protein EXR58_04355 [Chloroflexi bacterium]|nr:hypothetical protein [Chloroflexota bacterium]
MRFIKGFAAFWYDFIVGDSWELAVGILGLLIALKLFDSALPSVADPTLYILMPIAVVAVLGVSLARAER